MKRKRLAYVIWTILACIVIMIAAVSVWQWNNIEALYLYLTLDEEEVGERMENIRTEHHKVLEEEHNIVVKLPSREQSDALLDGKVTPEEVKESLGIGPTSGKSDPISSDNSETVFEATSDSVTLEAEDTSVLVSGSDDTTNGYAPEESTDDEVLQIDTSYVETSWTESISEETSSAMPPKESTVAPDTDTTADETTADTAADTTTDTTEEEPTKTAQELVNDCVSELYAYKVDVMATLGQMKKEMIDIWNKLPARQRTKEKKLELGLKGLDKCYSYEVKVDSAVQDILDKYRGKLRGVGANDGILDTLWEYYCEEKALEKAYYLNKYL